MLPNASGDLAIDSDVEQFSEDGLDGDDTVEPAGELEVEVEESSEEESEEEDADPPMAKRSKSSTPRWRKKTEFERQLSPGSAPRTLADQFPDLLDMSPFTLCQEIFSDAMADMIVSQSNLYANRDKNNQQFAIDRIDLARVNGVILLSGYHCLAQEENQ